MIWLTTASIIITLVLVYWDVEPLWIQLTAFAVSTALFLMMISREIPKPKRVLTWFANKRFILMALFFLSVVNFAARNYEHVFDLTESKIFSLRANAKEWLQKIDTPMQILIFLDRDDKTAPYAEWLQKQIAGFSKTITVEIKNINRDVLLAEKYGITGTGQTVLISDQHWIKTGSFKEDALVPGIMRLLSQTEAKLCFLVGHDEADIEDERPDGLSKVKEFLNDLGYRTQAVSLLQSSTEDLDTCTLFLVFGAMLKFLDQEQVIFENIFIKRPLFLALDAPASPYLVQLLAKWGVNLTALKVTRPDNIKTKLALTDIFVNHTLDNPIIPQLEKPLYLPDIQAIELDESAETWHSFLEIQRNVGEFQLLGDVKNRAGPFAVGVFETGKDGQPLGIILGGSKGFQNHYFDFGFNRQFFLNSIRWLLAEKEVEWLSTRATDEVYLAYTDSEKNLVRMICFFGLPGVVFLACLIFWVRRVRAYEVG